MALYTPSLHLTHVLMAQYHKDIDLQSMVSRFNLLLLLKLFNHLTAVNQVVDGLPTVGTRFKVLPLHQVIQLSFLLSPVKNFFNLELLLLILVFQ